MFSGSYEACGKIIPNAYVQQAQNARKSRENQIRIFLEHVGILLWVGTNQFVIEISQV